MAKRKKYVFISLIVIVLLFLFILFIRSENYRYYFYDLKMNVHYQLNNKELYFFATGHSTNPDNIMFDCIEKQMNKFHPDLLLVEGGANETVFSKEESYSHGESAFAVAVAAENSIPAENIEPSFSDQIKYLMGKYRVEDILSMYIIRQIGSYEILPDDNTEETTHEQFEETVLHMANLLIDAGLPYHYDSIDEILAILNTHLPEKITEENWLSLNCNSLYSLESDTEGIIHDIYVDVYNYRNIYLVELIQEKKNQYDRIFVVMGGRHLVDTKTELQKLYSEN